MNSNNGYVSIFGRLLIAILFLLSGFGKVAAPAMTQGYIASVGMPAPMLAYGLAIVVEIVGGVFLLIGYRARSTALIMAIYSITAAFFFHNHLADQNQMFHFFKDIAIAGGLLQIVANGAGSISLDKRRGA